MSSPSIDILQNQPLQFVDLGRQQNRIRKELNERIARVLTHGQYILGPEIAELESALANFVGVKHCISCSSGTDALLMAMLALGIGPGDEVITTPFTFFATGEMIELIGARAVFGDIDPITYNLDPKTLTRLITPKTKAIVPVSLYGQCADFNEISQIAAKHNLEVIEDAAQSFGAEYHGKKSCSLTRVSCTSFFPAKPLGCYGDGGACFTNDDKLAQTLFEVRNHGQSRRYYHTRLGINGRMDTLQAAILLSKLSVFPSELDQRDAAAQKYSSLIKKLCGDSVKTPTVLSHNRSCWAQYTVEVSHRAQVAEGLQKKGIPTSVHYPVPLTRQPLFEKYGYKSSDTPNSENASQRVLSLPMHPYLTDAEIERVVTALSDSLI